MPPRQLVWQAGRPELELVLCSVLVLELAETVQDGQFLRQGREVVDARFNCFGALEYPTECTSGAACTTLRTSMLSPNYWFSTEGL